MYESLKGWKTTLCSPDCESCTLSCLFPCHIYAMANKPYYAFHFILYAFVITVIHRLYYELYYMYRYACPLSRVDYCIGNSNCESHYTVVNGVTTPCHYYTQFETCGYSIDSCIKKPDYAFPIAAIWLSYVCLFSLNFTVRLYMKEKKKIQSCESCESTIPCGLAQVYREL
jgi:hypothetical protein